MFSQEGIFVEDSLLPLLLRILIHLWRRKLAANTNTETTAMVAQSQDLLAA